MRDGLFGLFTYIKFPYFVKTSGQFQIIHISDIMHKIFPGRHQVGAVTITVRAGVHGVLYIRESYTVKGYEYGFWAQNINLKTNKQTNKQN